MIEIKKIIVNNNEALDPETQKAVDALIERAMKKWEVHLEAEFMKCLMVGAVTTRVGFPDRPKHIRPNFNIRVCS